MLLNSKTFLKFSRFFKQTMKNFGCQDTFYAKDLVIKKTDKFQEKPELTESMPFGYYVTDHMFEVDYVKSKGGWQAPVISPYHKLEIDPKNSSLHYAIQLFEGILINEGMKTYKVGENVNLFRPEKNVERLLYSAERIVLPPFNPQEFLKCLEQLLIIDHDWIPSKRGYSVYIRPTYISMTDVLGVSEATDAKLFIILSPVGPYFKGGLINPIRITCSENHVRSWPGGFGYAKNYGPTLQHYREIKAKGFDQILWLIDDKVTEVGVMNFFVYYKTKSGQLRLQTAPLDGTILPGVVRDSVIQIAKEWGIETLEEDYTIHEVLEAIEDGRLLEAFGTGTAAMICPIQSINYKEKQYELLKQGEKIGPLAMKFFNKFNEILYTEEPHAWVRKFKV